MAGRSPKPWFWKRRRIWCVTLGGRRVNLGADKDAAHRRFHALMAGRGHAPPEPRRGLTVAELVGLYLADAGLRTKANTHRVVCSYLKPFGEHFGRSRASDLRPHQVDAWVRRFPTWNNNTRFHVLCRVAALFNWGVGQGYLVASPVKGLAKPSPTSRGATVLWSEGDHGRLMAAAPAYLRDVLLALHRTGCRPCEVLTVEARHFDPAAGVWVLPDHKAAGSTGRPRVVYLTPDVAARCRELAALRPTGPLFRRASGKPFPPGYYLARLVRRLRRKLGLPEAVTPYGLRHGFATDALAGGVPDAVVVELLGHANTKMLHKHYSHLGARADSLRAAANRVRGDAPPPPA
jgi:integrase